MVGKMTANANFPTPTPTLASITTASTALTVASKKAESGAHEDIKAAQAAMKSLRTLISALAKYVNSASGTDQTKALTSGFEAAKGHEPIVHLDAPQNLRVLHSFKKGTVALRWKPVHGARVYQVYTQGADGKWTPMNMSSKASILLIALESFKEYTLQVTAIGAAGESAASYPVNAVAA